MLKNTLKSDFNNLTRDEVVALVTANEEDQITNARLQVLLNQNSIEVNKILNILINKKLIKAEGQGRGTRYLLSEIFRKRDHINLNSPNNEKSSINNEGNSINSEMNSINKEGSSINNEGNSINNESNINKELIDIAKVVVNRKRVNTNLMDNVILKLCEVKPMELREIACLLNRNDVGLRNNYLNRLVKEGKLKLLYPGQINHPKQAYLPNINNKK